MSSIKLTALGLTVLTALVAGMGACAQNSPSLEERLFSGQIGSIDTIGVRHFTDQVSDVRTDSAEVYFNVRGEPVAWRAWIDGEYFVYWQPYGRFAVNDTALIALDVFKKNRQLLEMLEGMELVEQAAKKVPR
ncbi:MAG: hypothetical protein R3178_03925 [Rhodothermales bacterium]|nr:hypothetical protein [Rhodothermales bacterium]